MGAAVSPAVLPPLQPKEQKRAPKDFKDKKDKKLKSETEKWKVRVKKESAAASAA